MPIKEKLVLIGGGGHCMSVLDSLLSCDKYQIIGIIDANMKPGSKVLNVCVLGDDSLLSELFDKGVNKCFITIGSIGNYSVRKRVIEYVQKIGFEIINIIDKSATLGRHVYLGSGIFVGKNCVINAEVGIEDFCIINTGSIIEHECKIAAYSHIAPGAVLAGNVSIGYGTHVGLNATINQEVKIGRNCIIGSGSVILSNICDDMKVIGIYHEK